MAASTPREVVVKIDGLYFLFQKLRGRRAFRGERAARILLGPAAFQLISGTNFWRADEDAQLTSLDTVEHMNVTHEDHARNASITIEGAGGTGYDKAEEAMIEFLAYSSGSRGQGVSYRETAPDPSEPKKGWMAVRDLSSLDTYDQVDHLTWRAIRWEMIKLTYRPTSAATGTSPDTVAATTSTQASDPSGGATKPRPGTPTAASPVLGCSGG